MTANRGVRIAAWTAVVLAVLVSAALAFARSTRALEWAATQLSSAVTRGGGELVFEELSGSLLGTMRAARIDYAQGGNRARLTGVELDPSLLALWHRELVLNRIAIETLKVEMAPSTDPLTEPATLALPIDVRVDRASVGAFAWRTGESHVELSDISFGFRGGASKLAIEGLNLRMRGVPGAEPGGVLAVSLSGEIDAVAPFSLAARARAAVDTLGSIDLLLGGQLAELTVTGAAAGANRYAALKAALSATVAPFSPAWLPRARLETRGIDLAAWLAGAPKTALDLRIDASAARDRPVTGNVEAVNRIAGELGAQRLPVTRVSSGFEIDAVARRALLAPLKMDLRGDGRIAGRAALWIGGRSASNTGSTLDSDWTLEVSALDLHALDARMVATRLSGRAKLGLAQTLQRFNIALEQRDMRVEAQGAHAGGEVTLERVLARAGAVAGISEASGRARIRLDRDRAFEADLQLRAFDPSRFVALAAREPAAPASTLDAKALPQATLNARVQASGRLLPTWQVRLDADIAPSRLAFGRLQGAAAGAANVQAQVQPRVLPLQGRVRGLFASDRVEDADIALALGRNALRAAGGFGAPGRALDVAFDGSELSQLLPGLEGQVNAAAKVIGTVGQPAGTFTMKGAKLAYAGTSVGVFTARGEVGRISGLPAAAAAANRAASSATGQVPHFDPRIDVEFDARTLATGGLRLAQAGGRLAGTLDRHTLSLGARAPDLDTRVLLEGGLVAPPAGSPAGTRPPGASGPGPVGYHWRGRLTEARNTGRYPASLVAPVALELAADWVVLSPAQLLVGDGRLQVDELRWQPGVLATRGSLSGFPAGALVELAVPPPASGSSGTSTSGTNTSGTNTAAPGYDSTLRIGGQWSLSSTPRLNGSITLRREGGDIALRAVPPFALGLSRTDVDVRFTDDRVEAKARIEGSALGEGSAVLTLQPAPRLSLASPMTLRADLSVRTLKPFARYLGGLADVDGAFVVGIDGTGTPGKPELSGTLKADKLRADAPQYGLAIRDGRVDARLANGVLEIIALEASAGEGTFSATGSLPLRPGSASAPLTWRADRFSLLSRPDQRVVVDGDGTLAVERSRLLLAGRVRARSGHIEFTTAARATLGDDVVITGRKAAAPAGATRSPLALRLDLDFGDAFRIIGNGLDTNITGRMAFSSADDGTLSARGTVSTVRGTYSAFGQRLEIDRGSLIFNGPIDNPGLDILALRRLPSVEAGIELTGTVRAPLVRTTSNPPMSQGETLSWLVLGRSLETASQGDTALIAGIAGGMLGGTGAVPITRRIADTFGLDDVGVRSSSVIDGQVFTAGKRLSNRVYVAYEQAVSAATNLLRIDLELHQFVSLRAEAGAVSSFGIFYTRTLR